MFDVGLRNAVKGPRIAGGEIADRLEGVARINRRRVP